MLAPTRLSDRSQLRGKLLCTLVVGICVYVLYLCMFMRFFSFCVGAYICGPSGHAN